MVWGKEVRLKNAYVIKAERVKKDENGEIVKIYCRYDKNTWGKTPADGRKVKGVIHFVEATSAVPATFHLYEQLFDAKDPLKSENFTDSLNPNPLVVKKGFVEAGLNNSDNNATYQFEREGYFCQNIESDNLVFSQTVSLREVWQNK